MGLCAQCSFGAPVAQVVERFVGSATKRSVVRILSGVPNLANFSWPPITVFKMYWFFCFGDLAAGSHLLPFRTEKLSLLAAMVLLLRESS